METNKDRELRRKRTIKLILGVVFGVSGVIKIWLWSDDLGNDLGLYLGIALCLGSIISFADYFRKQNIE